jgi:hypothetical protein
MSTGTTEVQGIGLTSEEIELLINLLKHPKIQALAKEASEKEKEVNS